MATKKEKTAMTACYRNYGWLKGIPKGLDPVKPDESPIPPFYYKIIEDPYRKRYSIELYQQGRFASVVYDSILLDFRHIKPAQQQGWCKETASASENSVTCLIRNQDDRIIYMETHFFEGEVCRECRIFSPHEVLLARNCMLYRSQKDAVDGVVLLDRLNKPVMYKIYEIGEDGQFTELVEEQWDLMDLAAYRKRLALS